MKSLVFVVAAMIAAPVVAQDAVPIAEQIKPCWNVGSLSSEALRTSVIVGFIISDDGNLEASSIRLISSSGGEGTAARQAYEAARRAILRCGVVDPLEIGAQAIEFGPKGIAEVHPRAPLVEI